MTSSPSSSRHTKQMCPAGTNGQQESYSSGARLPVVRSPNLLLPRHVTPMTDRHRRRGCWTLQCGTISSSSMTPRGDRLEGLGQTQDVSRGSFRWRTATAAITVEVDGNEAPQCPGVASLTERAASKSPSPARRFGSMVILASPSMICCASRISNMTDASSGS
jgi:hypothetical protein